MLTMQSLSLGRMSAGVFSNWRKILGRLACGLVIPGKHLVSKRDKQRITVLKMNLTIKQRG